MPEVLHLEKPDYTQYAKHIQPVKIFHRSRGQCTCQSASERKECLNYSPDKNGHCKWLDKVLWIACLWRGND